MITAPNEEGGTKTDPPEMVGTEKPKLRKVKQPQEQESPLEKLKRLENGKKYLRKKIRFLRNFF